MAEEKEPGDELVNKFFAEYRSEMQKSSDDPGRMKEYVLSQKNLNDRDKHGRTLLHYASIKGYLPVVTLLLKRGGDVNVRDKDGRTPLHDAMSYFAYDVAKFVIKNGADMTAKDKNGNTPLFAIVFMDNKQKAVELLSFFIDNGFDIRKSADEDLLSESISRGHRNVALTLLAKGGAVDGRSLLAAARQGYEDVFGTLLEKGVEPNQERILSVACVSGNLTILKTLVKKGETPAAADVNLALYYGHKQAAAYLNDELKKAGKKTVDLRRRCDLGPVSSQCMANFTRAYFESLTSSCREFSYGGCGGEVPFDSVEACRNVCEDGK
jgi:ankyrin repeat protein